MRRPQLERAVLDAIHSAAPESHDAMVVGEALRNAGALEMPTERDAFIEFVHGPLRLAAVKLLGDEQAKALCASLLRATAQASIVRTEPPPRNMTMPSMPSSDAPHDSDAPRESGAPRQSSPGSKSPEGSEQRRRIATLDFQAARADVVVVDADPASRNATCALFEQQGYSVVAIDDPLELAAICQAVKPHLVVVGVRQAGGAIKAKRKLSKMAPAMLFVAPESGAKAPPLEGIQIVSRQDKRTLLAALREQKESADCTHERA